MAIFEDGKAHYNVSCGCGCKSIHAVCQKVSQPPTTRNYKHTNKLQSIVMDRIAY